VRDPSPPSSGRQAWKRLALAAVALLSLGAGAPPAARTTPIIDVHVHAYTEDPRFGSTWTNPLTGEVLKAAAGPDAHREEVHAAFERFRVIRAVTSGGDREAVIDWHRRDPRRILVGHAFDDPEQVDPDFLRAEHQLGRLHVLGEIAVQYAGISPADPRLRPIFALAEELDLPIGYHLHPGPPGAAYMGMPAMRAALGNPLLLEDALAAHPRARLYVMHAGWPFLDEMVALLYAHPQVYVEVGAIAWSLPRAEFHRYLRRLVEAGFGQRILFGSDEMVWPETIATSVRAIDEADFLTADQRADIFYRNAARFLKIELPRAMAGAREAR
jgi:predicted TIM-barrel fold metal-dependent hydrolase